MRTVPGLANVVNTASIARPEIIVTPKPDQAARAGVSAGAISQAVRVATIGDVDQNLPKYNLGDRQVPIRLRLTDDARENMSVLETLQGPVQPRRFRAAERGGRRALRRGPVADLAPGPLARGRDHRRARRHRRRRGGKRVHALSSVKNLPNGVKEVAAGDAEFIQEMVTGFAAA
jgi:hypothetical protein